MRVRTAFLFALMLAASVPAGANGASPAAVPGTATAVAPPSPPVGTAPPASAAAQADPNEKICKVSRELGSNRLKRVCRTRAQMESERDAAREILSQEQRR